MIPMFNKKLLKFSTVTVGCITYNIRGSTYFLTILTQIDNLYINNYKRMA